MRVENRNARHCTTSSSRFIKRGPVKTVDSKSQTVSADHSSSDLKSVKREQDRSVYIHTTKKEAQPKWLLDQRRVPTLSGSSLTPVQLNQLQFIRLRTDDSKLIDSQRRSAGLIMSRENVQSDILELKSSFWLEIGSKSEFSQHDLSSRRSAVILQGKKHPGFRVLFLFNSTLSWTSLNMSQLNHTLLFIYCIHSTMHEYWNKCLNTQWFGSDPDGKFLTFKLSSIGKI